MFENRSLSSCLRMEEERRGARFHIHTRVLQASQQVAHIHLVMKNEGIVVADYLTSRVDAEPDIFHMKTPYKE